jgi:ubiquinone/menaquinone biosynthesis C-methylase UbiE
MRIEAKDKVKSISLVEKGFALFDLLGAEEIDYLKTYYLNHQNDKPNGFYASTHSSDVAFRLATSNAIKEVVAPLIAQHIVHHKFLGAAFVVKSKNGNSILQAHQDWNLVDERNYRSYNVWIPLIDVNESNGTLFILESSHNKQLTWRGPQLPSPFIRIEQDIWKYLIPMNLKAGTALIYDHALLHGSSVNTSNVDRLGIVIGIMPDKVPMQLFGRNKDMIQSFACDETYFLTKDIETDYINLNQNQEKYAIANPITIEEFKTEYLGITVTKQEESFHPKDNRSFFEKYTLKNIVAEINYRLNKTKYGAVKAPSTLVTKTVGKDVATFYNEQTFNFLKVYGDVIQAFRTKKVGTLLDHQIEAIGLNQNVIALDAGCGVCGPAIYFANKTTCKIEALSISKVQVEIATQKVKEASLESLISVKEGDYHALDKLYLENYFDVVYFLESFGHATNHHKVLEAAWEVLKPGGSIYIKDLFIKKSGVPTLQKEINRGVENINMAYHYNVPDLNEILNTVREKGYILSSLKTIDIPLEEFENLTISNDFQELTGINRIDNLRNYVFPVDFFELKLIKPSIDASIGNSRYFLQNLYLTQVENWKTNDL